VWSFGKVKIGKWKVKLLPAVVFALALAVLRSGHSVPPVSFPAVEAVQVRVKHGDMVVTGPLEEYLVGVVAAEMPADFAPEALRAQAVAARTYTLYCMRSGKHADADVCTDYRCCQAWRGEEDAEKLARIRDAVYSTAGEYLQFAGQAAFTAFHSSSPGFTEACGAIWSELPYLVSVSSPESADSVPGFVSRVDIGVFDLRDTLLAACPDADFSAPPEEWFGEITRDESGRVSAAVICGQVFTGVKLRELLKLRSTAFTVDCADGIFTFTVTGSGHGVGMSQYGANVMAMGGADYREILAHYYPGTKLASLNLSS